MKKWLFRVMYWLGRTPWDSGVTPPEVTAAFEAGMIPPGPCLDLGCGMGTNVVFMARQGRTAVGIDFVAAAVAKARARARGAGVADRATFYVADVTRLRDLPLPPCAFALDMGCFHGLNPDGQQRYAEGLAATLIPGGRYMLYTLDPRQQAGVAFGARPEQVEAVFTPLFDIQRTKRNSEGTAGSTWFWMERKA